MKQMLIERGYIIRCLVFDGIMIDGNHYEDTNLLKLLENHINDEFEGLNMESDYKEHDYSIVIPVNFQIDEKVVKDDGAYLKWKKEFEKSHCKIINKSFCIKCIRDENNLILEFKTFTRKDLLTSYEHVKVKKEIYNEKTNDLDYVEVNCINSWVIDEEIRTYDDMNLYPPPLTCPKNIFNLWTPFYSDQLPISTIEENEDVDNIEKVQVIFDLIYYVIEMKTMQYL